ncbi:hypothetical protein [uncultured Gilvimarinus sp.]|uniref:hypothetical protein n=1 Tax=uncultured Gilvimarinus sp. TaxID=1689143 RepID=UPI0030EC32AF|tara:strand:- start:1361 stop:1873 length:513 start_codon:yes stop_codon:yes gene_type:complete
MRKGLWVIWVFVLAGCATNDFSHFDDSPWLIVRQDSGNCFSPCKSYPTGLILAVWSNGDVLLASDAQSAGQEYFWAKLSPEQMLRLRDFSLPMVGGDILTIGFHTPTRSIYRWDNINHVWQEQLYDITNEPADGLFNAVYSIVLSEPELIRWDDISAVRRQSILPGAPRR